jgi:hypothetical protein
MIGFSIYAHDNSDFAWYNSFGTEGDSWLTKKALEVARHPQRNPSVGAIDLIDNQFQRVKNALLRTIAYIDMDLTLFVTGDFNFIYQFQAGKTGRPVAEELLHLIAQQEKDMGDDVMMFFCGCLLDYHYYVAGGNGRRLLRMTILL